ncbi:MAG: rhomboid family intramembrane serine protease [Sneathiella sp.]|nr:rhomboid family intramembrane serine protease [Sneathiella sp.]
MEEQEERVLNVPPITKYMVVALIVVHILLLMTQDQTIVWVMTNFAFDLERAGQVLMNLDGQGVGYLVTTLTTHMFLHHDLMHLVLNAFMLLAFGAMVERYYGAAPFLIVFLLAGWIGAGAEYLTTPAGGEGFLYGASGAVFGMMGATLRLLYPRFGLQKTMIFAAVLMGVNLLIGLSPLGAMLAGDGATVSWAAHAGGFIAGFILSLGFNIRTPA